MSENGDGGAATTYYGPPPPPVCTGRAAEALAVYRVRESELRGTGQSKPDMVAFKELRRRWTPPEREHGELPGVPVGVRLQGRGEAAILGIHTKILSGIDAQLGESCFAVCMSGGYADDNDHCSDGSITYTGCGGQMVRRQVTDQEENTANASLIMSCDSGLPIRMLRGHEENGEMVYVYDGLYICKDYTYGPSQDGPKVYKFKLVPAEGNEKPKAFAVEYQSSSGATSAGAVKGGARIRLEHKIKKQKKRKASAGTSRSRLIQAMKAKKCHHNLWR